MEIRTIKQLRDVCSECESLYDILTKYTDSYTVEDIIENLKCTDCLYDMADSNGMNEESMSEWIKFHLDNSVECKIFQEHGPAGGWPVVEIQCLNMVFYFDWVLD